MFPWSLQRQLHSMPGQMLPLPEAGAGGRRQTPSLAAEHVPLERTYSTAPSVKTSRKSCNNKALGKSTFKWLVKYFHRHGSQTPPPYDRQTGAPISVCSSIRGPSRNLHHGSADRGLALFLFVAGSDQGANKLYTC
jgi:hypothetical protein